MGSGDIVRQDGVAAPAWGTIMLSVRLELLNKH